MTWDKWKLIWGQSYLLKQSNQLESLNTQLYNIMEDPNEMTNQDKKFPEVGYLFNSLSSDKNICLRLLIR